MKSSELRRTGPEYFINKSARPKYSSVIWSTSIAAEVWQLCAVSMCDPRISNRGKPPMVLDPAFVDEGAFRDLLGKFAGPGMLVCDPFVGGGTTAVVARELGCSFIGCDIDADCVATTWDVVAGLPVAA